MKTMVVKGIAVTMLVLTAALATSFESKASDVTGKVVSAIEQSVKDAGHSIAKVRAKLANM